MKQKKKHKYDPFQHTMDTAILGVGTIGTAGIISKTADILPSPISGDVVSGMEPLRVIPTMHATSGVFMSLQDLEQTVRKKRR